MYVRDLYESEMTKSASCVARTIAAIALGNATFEWKTSIFQALQILLRRRWPALGGGRAFWLGAEEKTDPVLLVQLALNVN